MQPGGLLQQRHALRVAGDAGQHTGIHQRSHGIGKAAEIHRLRRGRRQQTIGRQAFGAHRTEHPGVEGGIDGGHRHAHLQGALHGPEAGALLASGVDDFLHQVGAVGGVLGAQADFRDFHQERRQLLGGIPLAQHGGHGVAIHAGAALHQVVGLGQDLLDAVFDAVVHRFHKVPGTAGADVGDAGAVVDLGRHLAHQRFDGVVGGAGAAGHHARPLQCPLGATGDPHADVAEAAALELRHPPLGVGVERVAAVDQQVTLLQQG